MTENVARCLAAPAGHAPVVESELLYAFHRLASPPEVWIEYLKRAATCWGRLFADVRNVLNRLNAAAANLKHERHDAAVNTQGPTTIA